MDLIGLFDMDGTLFDYNGQLRRDLEKIKSPDEVLPNDLHDETILWLKARMDLIKTQPGWWRNLPKFKLGWDVYEVANELEFDCHVLTKGPWSKPQAWAEKVECVQYHFNGKVGIDIVGESKGNRYGRFLVDDWPPYLEDWLKHRPRGLAIVPAHDYNKNYTHPRAIRYDGSNIEEVRAALQIVKDRKDKAPLILRK